MTDSEDSVIVVRDNGGRFADLHLLLKTVVDSARQWKPVEHSGRDLPTVYLIAYEGA